MTRVLLVEDSTDILDVLQIELQWQGYAVDIAADAKSGFQIARLTRPDVIISDLRMPEEDGFEFIKRIRNTPDLAGIPAIALSGVTSQQEIQRALACGFTAVLTKPVEADDLTNMIESVTARHLARKAS